MAFVVPEEYTNQIITQTFEYDAFQVKTYTVRPKRRGIPDDETYIEFPALVKLVPRGFSDLFYNGEYLCSVRGPNKFDGVTAIDEDEVSNPTADSKSIFDMGEVALWASEGTLRVQFTEKANGKFAIATLFRLGSELWIFGGSKNRHRPCRFDEEITGTSLHDDILRAIVVDLKALPAQQLEQLVGHCIVGEYVDGKHLVYTETPYMVYFAVPSGVHLTKVKTVLPSIMRMPNHDELMAVRFMENTEGVVIEYHNTETGECLRQKHKSTWYIVWRCWREIISRGRNTVLLPRELLQQMKKRVAVRSEQFLNLSAEELSTWYNTAERFIAWFQTTGYQYADCSPFSSVGMAKIIHEFSNGISANVPTNASVANVADPVADPLEMLVDSKMYNMVLKAAKFGLCVAVAMSGPPGSGKSTVAMKLMKDLHDAGHTVERFSTDDFFMESGVYTFDSKKLGAYHKKNYEAFCDSKAQVRIVDNTNLVRWEYANYFTAAVQNVCIVLAMKAESAEILAQRNTHGVSVESMTRLLKKYKIAMPTYYGLFPTPQEVEHLADSLRLSHTQKTPPHVTVHFVGGSAQLNNPPYADRLGDEIQLLITGYSRNIAGECLVVEHELQEQVTQERKPHITLSTIDGYKPVDVGQNITVVQPIVIQPVVVQPDVLHPVANMYLSMAVMYLPMF
jgi:cytidylate kinase